MSAINLASKLADLQFLILDVDGVLTAGDIIYDAHGIEQKCFDVGDGLGIALLRGFGIRSAIITGRQSEIVRMRAKELGIEVVMQGFPLKLPAFEEIKRRTALPNEAFGFIGDDLIDIDVMRQCGFSAAPANAHPAVKSHATYVCKKRGGNGAVREIIDMIIAFRRGDFAASDFIPAPLLLHWHDTSIRRLCELEHDKDCT